MSAISKEEEIFESGDDVVVGNSESKLTSFKETIIDRPVGFRNEDVNENKLAPDAAFAVFNGKVFHNPGSEYYSLADSIERRVESPLQRYARLRGELDELRADLDLMVENEVSNSKGNAPWAVLQQEVLNLATAANTMASHKAMDLLRTGTTSHERALAGIVKSVDDLNLNRDDQSLATAAEAEGAAASDSSDLLSVEQRVHRLETLLGSTSNLIDVTGGSGGGQKYPYPLLEAVRRLEERAAALDAGELETLRVKCEQVRAELDSTLKSKSTLAAEAKVAEAARQLSGLLAVADRVDAVVGDLPALVLRLKTLEQVHAAAAGFTGRLGQMEQDVRALSGQLSSNRDVLAELRTSLRDSIAAMQQNVTAVDAKIASLEQ